MHLALVIVIIEIITFCKCHDHTFPKIGIILPQVIKSKDGKESETEYFAALVRVNKDVPTPLILSCL